MKIANPTPVRFKFLIVSLFAAAFAGSALAQHPASFATKLIPVQIYTIASNGTYSVYDLKLSINAAGSISGSGKRYDVAQNSLNITGNGTAVSINTSGSKVGTPGIKQTNPTTKIDPYGSGKTLTDTTYNLVGPVTIQVSDGTRLRGAIVKSKNTYQYWDGSKVVTENSSSTDTSIFGGAVQAGRTGIGQGYSYE
jgi:hypothetical protein